MIFKENKKHWFFTSYGYVLLFVLVFLTPFHHNVFFLKVLSPLKSLIFLFCFLFLIFNVFSLQLRHLIKFDIKKHVLDLFFVGILITIAIYQFFVLFSKVMTGRFLLLEALLGSMRCTPWWNCSPRTSISALYMLLYLFYPVTPLTISFLTRIFAMLTVFVFYKTLRRFVPSLLSFLTSLILLFSYYFVSDSLSIEPIMFALLFTYLSFYFYVLFQDSKDIYVKKRYLVLSFLSVLIASGGRFELSLMLGLPYLFVLLVTNSTKYLGKSFFIFLTILLLFSYPALSVYRPEYKDPFLKGEHDNLFIAFLTNFYNSVFVEHHLSLNHNYVSLTYYLTLFFTVFYFFLYRYISRRKSAKKQVSDLSKDILSNHPKFLIFIVYFLFYSCLILFLHHEGFSSPVKYNINFYLSELIILTYSVYLFARLFFRKSYLILSFALLFFFFLVSFELSPDYYIFRHSVPPSLRAVEMNLLENISLDPSCFIIKDVRGQPLIDYYKGMLKNDIFLGDKDLFYKNLDNQLKIPGCYYYYDAFYSEFDYNVERIPKYNLTRIKNIALSNNCTVLTVFHHNFTFGDESKNISLIKIIC